MINQLDLRAGTRLDDSFKSSGKTKHAKATAKSSIGIAIAGIIGFWYSFSINNCPKDIPQTRKYRDSYKLLIGKCPDKSHLEISCIAINRLIVMVINLTYEDNFLLNKAVKEIGKLINKK